MKLIIFLLILSSQVFGQSCGNVNYLTRPNSPFSQIPVADQDGTGICYAYTSAQLVNYHLIRTRQTQEPVVHPVWVALKASRRILDQGFELNAINALRTNGSCGYDFVETALNVFGMRARLEGSPLVAFLEAYARSITAQVRSSGGGDVTEAMVETAYNAGIDAASPHCSDDVLWDQLLPELRAVNETSVQLFTRLLRSSCNPETIRRYNIPVPLTAGAFESHEQAKLTLADQIGKGPFTFGYCSQTWYDSGYNGMSRPSNASGSDCGMHSSIAVGRKQRGPHCYMLVRNTWGTGWGQWNENQTCLCKNKTTGAWVDECNSIDHNDGEHTVEACYIGMNQLSRNLQDITTFNP